MAQKNLDDTIKAMREYVEERAVRSAMNRQRHRITATLEGLTKAAEDGYNKVVNNNKLPKNEQGEPIGIPEKDKNKVFAKAGLAGIQGIQDWLETAKSAHGVPDLCIPNKKVVYIVATNSATHRQVMKNPMVKVIEEAIGGKFSRPADLLKADREANPNSSKEFFHFLRASGVSEFKSGTEGAHIEKTVGAAQFLGAMDYLSKDPRFGGFIESDVPKDLKGLYGNVKSWFKLTAGDTFDTSLVALVDIEMEMVGNTVNTPGSDPNDWINISPKLEEWMKEWAKKTNWWKLSGSNTLQEDFVEATLNASIKRLTKSPLVKAFKKPKKVKRDDRYADDKTGKPKGTKSSKKRARGLKKAAATKASRGIASQPLMLLAVLQKELPATVRKNMNSPMLENKTGRFANSVRVTGIQSTATGLPSIGYTYQKDPYQVFESSSGTRFSDSDRDPRKIINQSIREIAAQFAIGRFYTRRE